MTELDNKQVNDHQRVEQRGKERSRPQLRDLHLHITGGRGHSLGSLTVALGAATFDALVAAGADFSVASASFNACNPARINSANTDTRFHWCWPYRNPTTPRDLPQTHPTTARGDYWLRSNLTRDRISGHGAAKILFCEYANPLPESRIRYR